MKRGKFALSHTRLLTGNMGALMPVAFFEVLPGDTIQQKTALLLRCAPLMAPVMHPVRVRIHHWFVPYRLLWEDWESFITGGPDGMDASVVPTIHMPDTTGFLVGSLADYLGLPTGVDGTGSDLDVNAFAFRAYAKIFNECYRDQDLQTAVALSLAGGLDTTTSTALLNCAWEKDYFTAARPWAQKGPAVTIPLGTTAPVLGVGSGQQNYTTGDLYETDASGARSTQVTNLGGGNTVRLEEDPNNSGFPRVYADLANASAVTVNLLREALSLQRYEEARARYGSRYVEYLRYLGVRSSDARLDRPEYLGGGIQTIQFSEVLQTSEAGTTPLGTMGGHGIAAMGSNRYRKFFEEHGCVLSLLSVQPKTIYQDGIERKWSRRSKEEFWQKEFQHIGQQEVLYKEVYADHSTPTGTFGWSDRYAEYRREASLVTGEFRAGGTYDEWSFARSFGSDPALNADFVKCVPTEEPFADQEAATLVIQAKHSIQARRLVAGSASSFIF